MLGGTILTGEDILAAEVLGADFAYIGTRFIAAKEMGSSPEYKQMVVEAGSEGIIYTPDFSGIHANYLILSIVKAGIDPDRLPDRGKFDLEKLFNVKNVKAWRDIWGAGQGVGSINKIQAIQKIVEELEEQYQIALNSLYKKHGSIGKERIV